MAPLIRPLLPGVCLVEAAMAEVIRWSGEQCNQRAIGDRDETSIGPVQIQKGHEDQHHDRPGRR